MAARQVRRFFRVTVLTPPKGGAAHGLVGGRRLWREPAPVPIAVTEEAQTMTNTLDRRLSNGDAPMIASVIARAANSAARRGFARGAVSTLPSQGAASARSVSRNAGPPIGSDPANAVLRRQWSRQARALDFSAKTVVSRARRAVERTGDALNQTDLFAIPHYTADQAAEWAVKHLSERHSVFSHTALLTAVLGREPGAVTAEAAEKAISELAGGGGLHPTKGLHPAKGLHAARDLGHAKQWTTDAALARESETISLMRAGRNRATRMMRRSVATTRLHRGRLNEGQKEAVRIALSSRDRVIGVQGYAGSGKTTMLKRFRDLSQRNGYTLKGLAPSASAAKTLREEAGIPTETLQRFLARQTGIIEGRVSARGLKGLRTKMSKTVRVVDEASLASTEQLRGLLRAATAMRLPRVVLVGGEKQLDGVDAGKPFGQLMKNGMQTAVLDEILRQKDAKLKSAVKPTLEGEIKAAFKKIGNNVTEIERNKLADEAAQRWLALSHSDRDNTGVIAPTRALRDSINRIIRDELLAQGEIRGPERTGIQLLSRGLTRAQGGCIRPTLRVTR